ncbi:MAG: glycoside hydrolase family 5 protein [Alphaproteobacteria bacterium]|nr:glycoside hydrolase family 5 protein [Alphaproteobacteria bacterium]
MNRRPSFSAIMIILLLAVGPLAYGGEGDGSPAASPADVSPAPRPTGLDIAKQMSPGWNLGNALDAFNARIPAPASRSQETAWGNPPVTQALLDAVKAAGFNTVRIPVAWSEYADADNNISPAWLARVTQVVNYARKAGLYVIINVHWDGGWLQSTDARQAAGDAKLAKFWTQIADNFKNYDSHLLFAGTNEIGADGVSKPDAENCAVQNGFNQTFVNAVRATGGGNATRYLIVQGYNTNIDQTLLCDAKLPTDTAARRLMMEVHYYDPYNLTINERSNIWQWGKIATDRAAKDTWGDEAWADAQFEKMKAAFVDKGIPVILGEYAAMRRTEYDPTEKYSTYWDAYITHSAYEHGLVPVYWDNGYTGNHASGLFDRATGAQAFPDTIRAIVDAVR